MIHETLGRALQDFGKGFARIFKTLGGFARLWEKILKKLAFFGLKCVNMFLSDQDNDLTCTLFRFHNNREISSEKGGELLENFLYLKVERNAE